MLRKKALSVGYALKGIRIAYVEESNFQIQLVIGVLAVIAGLYYEISVSEWLFVVCASGLVLTAELLNTALEEFCDMYRSSHDPHVAKIKDLAAGGVLVASMAALLVGVIIFLPKAAGL
jgi:diacylglycerol kinase